MPVLKVYLDTSHHSDEALSVFLTGATRQFASTLECPEERIRVYLINVNSKHCAVGGVINPSAVNSAPFFEFYLLAGRPPEHKKTLSEGFTALLADQLDYEPERIRGCCLHAEPDDWAIGGVSAADLRSQEIAERANQSK